MIKIGFLDESRRCELAKALEEAGSDSFSLDEVLQLVQDFVESSHFIGFDPIPYLESLFTSFEWAYYELPDAPESVKVTSLKEIIESSDYFWPVAGSANPDDWLVARKKGVTKRLSLCGCLELLALDERKGERALDRSLPKEVRAFCELVWGTARIFKKSAKSGPDI